MAPINVQFKLYSILKQYGREKGIGDAFSLQVEPGTTLAQMVEQVGIPSKRIGRFIMQGKALQPDYAPADGDAIDLVPPTISGG